MILKIIWIDVFLRKKRKSNKKKSNVNIIDRGGTVKNVQRKNIYIFFFYLTAMCHVSYTIYIMICIFPEDVRFPNWC